MLITDRDPVLAAKAVPLEYMQKTIQAIEHGYNVAIVEKRYKPVYVKSQLNELICSDLLYSRKNAEWLSKFYTKLCDYMNIDTRLRIHFNLAKLKGDGTYMINPLGLHSPLLDIQYDDLVKVSNDRYKSIKDVVTLSRVMLIDLQPQLEDFIEGIPSWLIDVSVPLIEAFDEVNRRHIKIERDSTGKLHYFTSFISDKWEEICGVPKEMDYIVLYLASNRGNLTLFNQ
jgi:hypothetical protein